MKIYEIFITSIIKVIQELIHLEPLNDNFYVYIMLILLVDSSCKQGWPCLFQHLRSIQ